MSRWFRVYDDVINDPKLLKLPEALRWQWLALLCVASKNGGKLPPNDDIALLLRVPEAKAAEFVTKLVRAKLIDNEDGVFVPHNWDGRQFKSDTSNDRVKRHRENKRNATCNVTSGVTDTVTVTAPEAEQKSDTEQSRAEASAPVDEDLKRRASALGAGISAHFVSRGQSIPNLDRCLLWLTQGYASGTILGAVERCLKRGKVITTLDYFDGAIRDDHAKIAAPAGDLQVVSSQVFVISGTLAAACWEQHSRSTGGRGYPTTTRRVDGSVQEGWYHPTEFPPGYDEQTGERLPAQSGEEHAA
ncbi:MAG: hypothetical protein E6Q77_01670 [Rhizobium sp.]|nr:MAG: hypothetical protein E6Q77_01670 [Rhizobium sp.]